MTPTFFILLSSFSKSSNCCLTFTLSLIPVTFFLRIPAASGSVIAENTTGILSVDCAAACAVLVAIA